MKRPLWLGISVAVAVAALLIPWWRNHALVRDFYDYGLVMAAAGRVNLGEHPYVDFATPIQTLHFILAAWAERMLGPRYLSLTYANAGFIGLGCVGLWVMLRRRIHEGVALLVAMAVVAASAGQHTIVWHNAMGVAVLAGVSWTMAWLPAERSGRICGWAIAAVCLWLGGMTKVTYQVAALAFALLFVIRARVVGRISTREAVVGGLACLIAGVMAPVATEMAYTGATFAQWKHNVLELARSRTDLLQLPGSVRFYFKTPHDYYPGAHFEFAGAWGVVLILLTAVFSAKVRPREGWIERGLLGAATLGAIASGLVLLATNLDIAFLSGAAWLVMAVAIALAFGDGGQSFTALGKHRRVEVVLGLAAISLLVPAWLAAWKGTRALWGPGPLVRTQFQTADDLPARFAYLRGVQITEAWHTSLNAFDERMSALAAEGVPGSKLYFANGTEWMVRAVPEARHRGLPLWLHYGTTFSPRDVWLITERLNRDDPFLVLISDVPWDTWSSGMESFVQENYVSDYVGGELRIYRWRRGVSATPRDSLDFALTTKSNLARDALIFSGGPPGVRHRADGAFFGSRRSWAAETTNEMAELTGEFVAELLPGGADRRVTVDFRVRQVGGARDGEVLMEEHARLAFGAHDAVVPFTIRGEAGRVRLEIGLPDGEVAAAGWRKLQVMPLDGQGPGMPLPLDARLPARDVTKESSESLYSSPDGHVPRISGYSIDVRPERDPKGPYLFVHAPAELWFEPTGGARHLRGSFGFKDVAWTHPGALVGVRVALVFAKSGRLEVLMHRELRPQRTADREPQHFEVTAPETGGRVGVIVTTLETDANAFGHLWFRDFATW